MPTRRRRRKSGTGARPNPWHRITRPGMKFTTDRRRARTFMCTPHVGAFLDAMGDGWNGPLNKVDAFRYEIPRSDKPAMGTNGLVFIDGSMGPQLRRTQATGQVPN